MAVGRVRAYLAGMARNGRSNDWGFPRWRPYGTAGTAAEPVRLCDRYGCPEKGDRPAPKRADGPERWYFCEPHAAEYNRNWNYFEGLSAEEAARRESSERAQAGGFEAAGHYRWAGPGDGTRTRDEMRALEVLELEPDADFEAARVAWRALAKRTHPDVAPGDAGAAERFAQGQAAFAVLRASAVARGEVAA